MADILKNALGETYPSGLKTPSQTRTIAGPGVRLNNMHRAEKQTTLPVVGRNK